MDITGTKADGSLYLDDGESFSYENGEFVWRGFQLSEQANGSKNLVLSSRSLHDKSTATSRQSYDPEQNAWAKKIDDVVVRKIVFLGLPIQPSCVKLAGSTVGLQFEWKDGLAATAGRRRGGPGKTASELIILDAPVRVVKDWDIVIEFGSTPCSITPAVDHSALLISPACQNNGFRCENVGHIPSCILPSRVNDGICDPECCDGSDETDGKVQCPNLCKSVGAEYKKKTDEEGRKRRVGASVRKEYITFGKKERAKLEAEVEQLKKEVDVLKTREATVKASLEALETAEAGDIERKKSSVLYEKIVEMQEAIKALRLHRANLEGHVSDLSGILADLSVSSRRLNLLFSS